MKAAMAMMTSLEHTAGRVKSLRPSLPRPLRSEPLQRHRRPVDSPKRPRPPMCAVPKVCGGAPLGARSASCAPEARRRQVRCGRGATRGTRGVVVWLAAVTTPSRDCTCKARAQIRMPPGSNTARQKQACGASCGAVGPGVPTVWFSSSAMVNVERVQRGGGACRTIVNCASSAFDVDL